jgi:plastocyanin
MPRATVLAPALALALALVAPACGGDDEEAADGGGDTIGMENLQFAPRDAPARVGQEVVWRNGESIPHNVVATDGADFRSALLQEGQEFRYTPTRGGTIQYVCTIHREMAGTLRVSASG